MEALLLVALAILAYVLIDGAMESPQDPVARRAELERKFETLNLTAEEWDELSKLRS